ncbi:MAG: hypothetical protein HFJ10_05715 [Lachnospiraceae bacterium]|nr:hypothetical protein [Lachnospiraceae bacterium]
MDGKRRKIMLALALTFIGIAAVGMATKNQTLSSKAVLTTEHVAVPDYTGRKVQAVAAQEVDGTYMNDLKQRSLELFNSIKGTAYREWTDELVKETTNGRFQTEQAWTAYMQEGYQKVEKDRASRETAQKVLEEILLDTRLIQYGKEDYTEAEKGIMEQTIYGSGYLSEKDYLDDCGITNQELKENLKEDVLKSLKCQYVIEAIAEKEKLVPAEAEMEKYRQEHMQGLTEMGYGEDDIYYQEELQHYMEEEPQYRRNVMTEHVLDFLYENSAING